MTTSLSTAMKVRRGMAKAFFANAYADLMEEAGTPLSGEIMDQTPVLIDPAALHAADTLMIQFLDQFIFHEPNLSDTQKIAAVYMRAVNVKGDDKGDRELEPELFGHYLAMQAMGTGVGLESFGSNIYKATPVPYLEFGSHSLEGDYGQKDAEYCDSCNERLEPGQIGKCESCD